MVLYSKKIRKRNSTMEFYIELLWDSCLWIQTIGRFNYKEFDIYSGINLYCPGIPQFSYNIIIN